MRCPQCQHENRDEAARFCEECGMKLVRACPGCGHEVSPQAKFCSRCGKSLMEAPSVAPPFSPQAYAPKPPYTPKHLAEKILTTRSALEGKRTV